VAKVPTGIKRGVSTGPWGVCQTPTRAPVWGHRAINSKENPTVSVISYQLSVISYQLSVISYQLSVTSIFAHCLKGAIVVVFVFKLHIPLSRKYLSNHGFEGIGIETGFHIGVLEWITQGN